MLKRIFITATLLIVGLIVGLNLQDEPSNALSTVTPPKTNHEFLRLQNENREIFARLTSLETQFIEHKKKQQVLLDNSLPLDKPVRPPPINLTTSTSLNMPLSIMTTMVAPNQASLPLTDRKTQALLALGLDETITQRIQERKEKLEMDHLYLRDTAIREGWLGTEKYFEKTQKMSQTINVYREELGDAQYDQYLHNVGQNNRVRVSSVISHSPAEDIGIQEGDVIAQYDHERIFSWSDLTQATSKGEAGQEVSIVIQRYEDTLELFIPRGPLGVRLENFKINPSD